MKTGRESKATAAYQCPYPGCIVRISDFENLPAHIAEQHPYKFHDKRQVNLCFTITSPQHSLRQQPQSEQEQQPYVKMSDLGTCPECNDHFSRETPTEMVKAVGKHRRMHHHPKVKSSANFKRRYLRKNKRYWEIEQRILPYMALNKKEPCSNASASVSDVGTQTRTSPDSPLGEAHIGDHVQPQKPDLQSAQTNNCFLIPQTMPTHSAEVTRDPSAQKAMSGEIQRQRYADQEHQVMVMWSNFLLRSGLLKHALPNTNAH